MESITYQVTRYNLKKEDIINAVADYIKKITNREVDKKQFEWHGQNTLGGFDFETKEKLKLQSAAAEENVSIDEFSMPEDTEEETENIVSIPVAPMRACKVKLKKV